MWFLTLPHAAAAPKPDEAEPPLWQVALEAPPDTRFKEEKVEVIEVAPKQPQPEQGTVEAMVAAEFVDAPIMVRVARAESQFDPKADNQTSTAYGVFQILIGTWHDYGCTGDRGNAADNIACARIIYDKSGLTPWASSKGMWAK